jgi:hypothetical protein
MANCKTPTLIFVWFHCTMLKGGVFQCLNICCTSKKRFTTFSGIKAHMGQCCRTRCDAPVDQKTEDYINEEDAPFCPETDFCEMPSTPDTLPEIGYGEAILEENLCTIGLPSHYHNEIYGMDNWLDCNDDNSTEDEIRLEGSSFRKLKDQRYLVFLLTWHFLTWHVFLMQPGVRITCLTKYCHGANTPAK